MTSLAQRPSKRDTASAKQHLREMLGLWSAGNIDRRSFLSLLSACASWGAVATPLAGVGAEQRTGDRDAAFWSAVAAVQEHLFPADGNGPGAVDINAAGYLRQIFDDPYVEAKEKDFLSAGIAWLDGFCVKQHDGHFDSLEHARREQVLMNLASSPAGRDWVALMIYYILEALLTDPVYGGNSGGAGWDWLDHQPGFPRPPVGRRHYEL
jgi:gluconate 2-dehydrogenase gamma chain